MSFNEEKEKIIKKQADVERGQRLKKLRALAGLDLNELADLIDVNRVTMSYWQSGSPPGLSVKGAHKVVSVLKEAKGIECHFEWLWEGTGKPPYIAETTPAKEIAQIDEGIFSIQTEINLFMRMSKDTVVMKINTGQLYPFFKYHDIVGGIWQPVDTLMTEDFCIVKLNHTNQVRWVKKTEKNNCALLSYSPSDPKTEEAIIEKFAPIMRLWR